ncbi:MAG: MFS transporter [Proteobacteria bacterium]|nr:MFS transporter [Pseudomonadota bacterium]
MTVSYIDRSTLAVLAPTVTKALDISDAQYGWLTSAFSMAYLIATPVAGWWIDRVGVRRGLVASVLVWSSFAALHALVPGFGVLFALRIALGVTEGPSFPGAALTMARVLPPEDRSRGFGVLFTGSMLIEVIFSLDGIGLLGFEAALNRDYPVMFGTLYFFGLIGLIMGIVGDLMYMIVDPRIDFEARA